MCEDRVWWGVGGDKLLVPFTALKYILSAAFSIGGRKKRDRSYQLAGGSRCGTKKADSRC